MALPDLEPTENEVRAVAAMSNCGLMEAKRRVRKSILVDFVHHATTLEELREALVYLIELDR